MFGTVNLFGREIAKVTGRDLESVVRELSATRSQSVYFCNVHMLMLSREDRQLAQAMDQAGVAFADGVPVAWLQSRITGEPCSVVRGYEIMLAACQMAAQEGKRVGLFGATQSVLDALAGKLRVLNPSLEIALKLSPPQVDGELISSAAEIGDISAAHLDWLFVSLGCPKQEKWIHRHGHLLDCQVLGVGAAFDWLAGTTPMPPQWMQRTGLGWLFRLLNDPQRMWHRYLIYNTKFIFATAHLLITRRFSGERK